MEQPKHIVLTARNTPNFSRVYVKWFKSQFVSLRRSKFASNWHGGMFSLEVTNEGRGWHLHLHGLVEAKWIDSGMLAKTWSKRVQQDFAIVCVKDVRDKSYAQEVMKYAVKGSELAAWKPEDIATFIDALTGVKLFGVFGDLFKDRVKRQRMLDDLESPPKPECPECHSTNLRYLDTNEHEEYEVTGHFPGRRF